MKITRSIVTTAILLAILIAGMGSIVGLQPCKAAGTTYSANLISELGEASTMLIYSEISANIKIYFPDVNWLPLTTYFLVPVTVWSMGSGFFISADGYIITAGHVIFCFTHKDITQDLSTKYFLITESFNVIIDAFADNGIIIDPADQATLLTYIETYGEIKDSIRDIWAILGEVKMTLTDIQSKGWTARVIDVSPFYERDIALLKIEPPQNSPCPILVVGDSAAMSTGSDVYAFGFADVTVFSPQMGVETVLAPSMKEGRISQKRVTSAQTPVFETSASITHGFSGGPALNNKGEVIGICNMGSVRSGIEVAGFNFMVESNVAANIMNEANVKNKNVIGPVDQKFIDGLLYFYDKHYSAAKGKFDECVGLFDYHWRAKALVKDCNAAIARGEDVPLGLRLEMWMIILIIAIVAVVVIVPSIVLLRKRGKTKPGPPVPHQ